MLKRSEGYNNSWKMEGYTRKFFRIQYLNGKDKTPVCVVHEQECIKHKNKCKPQGFQWVCKLCSREKSKNLRRGWKTAYRKAQYSEDLITPFEYNIKRIIAMAKFDSKKKGRDFSIDYDFVKDLWKKQDGRCAITNEIMDYIPGNNSRKPNKVTMDRINSAMGYTKKNVWLVCDWVNRAKSDLSKEQLISFSKGILDKFSDGVIKTITTDTP